MDQPQGGCMREVGPCLGWGGVREQLRALASRQREGGWTTLVVLHQHAGLGGEPGRAGASARRPARGRARRARTRCPPTARWSRTCSRRRGEEGAALTLLQPLERAQPPGVHQPAAAGVRPGGRRARAPAAYAQIATTLQQALDDAPGDQQLVLGETAGLMKSTRYVTSVPDFIAGPAEGPGLRDHGLDPARLHRRRRPGRAGRRGARRPTAARTRSRSGSPRPASAPRPRTSARAARSPDAAAGCRALHDQLVRWYEDPRVTIAFQYTVREDDKFPTGLVSTDLDHRPPGAEGMDRVGRRPQPRPTRPRNRPAALLAPSTVTVLVTAVPPVGLKVTLTASLPLRETLSFSAAVPACLTVLEALPTTLRAGLGGGGELALARDLHATASRPRAWTRRGP